MTTQTGTDLATRTEADIDAEIAKKITAKARREGWEVQG